MIKLKSINNVKIDSSGKKIVDAILYADTKDEVLDTITGADIDDLDDNSDIDVGTIIITAGFDVAQLNSSHEWVWGGE